MGVWDFTLKKMDSAIELAERNGIDTTIPKLIRIDNARRNYEGIKKYNVELQSHNGRDWMIDAYQEAMDLKVYSVQGFLESNNEETAAMIAQIIELAAQAEMLLRTMIYRRDGK